MTWKKKLGKGAANPVPSPKKPPLVSFVTITFNASRLCLRLAHSMKSHIKHHHFEWVILDNGTDGTTETLKRYWERFMPKHCVLKILEHDNSGNFASMNNSAVKYASHPVICFLNSDVELKSDIITPAVAALESNEKIGVVGAVLRFRRWPHRLQHGGIFIHDDVTPGELSDDAISALGLRKEFRQPEKLGYAPIFKAVTAACSFMWKRDFLGIGGFHDEFDWAFEDVDLCFRVGIWLNKLCIVHPDIRLYHVHSHSGGNRRISMNLSLLKGRYRGMIPRDYPSFR